MRILTNFFLLFLLVFCSTLSANCHKEKSNSTISFNEINFSEFEVIGDKVYIRLDQMLIEEGGIFVKIQGTCHRVSQLNSDAHGLYISPLSMCEIRNTCWNGHKIWCWRCGGCGFGPCPFRCKCFG